MKQQMLVTDVYNEINCFVSRMALNVGRSLVSKFIQDCVHFYSLIHTFIHPSIPSVRFSPSPPRPLSQSLPSSLYASFYLSMYLTTYLPSFLTPFTSFLLLFLPSFLTSFFPPFLPPFLPSFLHSLLPSLPPSLYS